MELFSWARGGATPNKETEDGGGDAPDEDWCDLDVTEISRPLAHIDKRRCLRRWRRSCAHSRKEVTATESLSEVDTELARDFFAVVLQRAYRRAYRRHHRARTGEQTLPSSVPCFAGRLERLESKVARLERGPKKRSQQRHRKRRK